MAKKKKKAVKKKAVKKAPVSSVTEDATVEEAGEAAETEKPPKPKKSEDSKLRLWVNPQGPVFSSIGKHVPKGVKVGTKMTKNYNVRYVDVSGPGGFVPPTKGLYDWLLKQRAKRGVPIFLSEKPDFPTA